MAGSISIFNKAIEDGLILTKFNLCCPDCDGAYSLTNYEDFVNYYETYIEALDNNNDVGELCCLSLFVNEEDYFQFVSVYGDNFPDLQNVPTEYGEAHTQCGVTSDFMFYINQLSVLLGDSVPGVNFIQFYIENFGIIEINTLSGHSGLKFIFEFLSSTGLTQNENQNLFYFIMGNPKKRLLNKGLVIRCINNNILISNTENYYEFLDNFYGANLYLCLKTQRQIEGIVESYIYQNILPQNNLVNGKLFYVVTYNENGINGNYYIFWSIANNRWEVWSGFDTITNTGVGIFHSSLVNSSLDLYLTSLNWNQETNIINGNVIDSSLKVECDAECNFREELEN